VIHFQHITTYSIVFALVGVIGCAAGRHLSACAAPTNDNDTLKTLLTREMHDELIFFPLHATIFGLINRNEVKKWVMIGAWVPKVQRCCFCESGLGVVPAPLAVHRGIV
jgi:hypothetical protein